MAVETKASSANVVLIMAFTQPSPPSYLKGERRKQYLEERAWYTSDHIDYAGRMGKYDGKAESFDEQFAQLPGHGNFLDYVSRQGTFSGKGEAGGHDLSGTGIFGRDGKIEGEALEALRKELQTTKSNVWHGVISPKKEVGEKCLANKEMAMEFMKANFDRFINMTHLQAKNVEWYAGWHDDSKSGIKHIQFAFWERAPHLNSRGKECFTQRGCIPKHALADGLEQFEEYFSGHRDDLYVVRDNLSKYMRQASPKEVKRSVAKKLIALAGALPKVNGRAGYNHPAYMPYRKQIDAIATELIRDVPAIRERYQAVMSRLGERESRHAAVASAMRGMQPSGDAMDKLRADIRARMGNSVIAMARRFAFDEDAAEWDELQKEQDRLRREKLKRHARQRQNHLRKKNYKRISRLFDTWYLSGGQSVLEYYEEFEAIQAQSRGLGMEQDR